MIVIYDYFIIFYDGLYGVKKNCTFAELPRKFTYTQEN